tara:strand:+ start:180 stop:530 length:351 start_codon:yes stop_codon:yes gene_type:complete
MAGKKDKGEENNEDLHADNIRVSELVKKLVSAGIGAAFMTEEGIRSYLGGIKLPKEVLNLLVQGANKSKDEMMNVVSKEVIRIIKGIDFVEEASRFVEDHKFRINAEIEVIKKEKA